MILQSPFHPFRKAVPPRWEIKVEVSQVAMSPNDGTTETIGTAVRVAEFDAAHFRN